MKGGGAGGFWVWVRFVEPLERVEAALAHRAPDRTPLDLGGPANGLSVEVVMVLARRVKAGLPRRSLLLWDRMQRLSEIPDTLLLRLGVDIRHIHFSLPLRQVPGGSGWIDWLGLRYVERSGFLVVAEHPLAEARRPRQVEDYPWPRPKRGWLAGMEKQAEMYHSAGYAVAVDPPAPGPLQLGCMMAGWTRFLSWLSTNPETASRLMDQAVQLQIQLWELAGESGVGDHATLALVADDYGSEAAPLLSPSLFSSLLAPRLSQLVKAMRRAAPKASILLHSCGAIRPLIPSIIEAGFDVLSPLPPTPRGMNPAEIKSEYGDIIVLHGGIDLHQLQNQPRTQAISMLRERLALLSAGGGYISSLTHNVYDPNQLDLLLEALHLARQAHTNKQNS